jgi:hypothetical protein
VGLRVVVVPLVVELVLMGMRRLRVGVLRGVEVVVEVVSGGGVG